MSQGPYIHARMYSVGMRVLMPRGQKYQDLQMVVKASQAKNLKPLPVLLTKSLRVIKYGGRGGG